MASSLLDKSLDEITRQRQTSNKQRRGAGANSLGSRSRSSSERNNPYSRPLEQPPTDEQVWSHDLYDSSGRPARRRDSDGSRTSAKLQVSNLHYEVSERELEALFSQLGELEKPPSIKFDKSGRSEGRAWVVYKLEKTATEAIRMFNGANAKGQPITVEYDFTYTRPTAPPALLGRLEGGGELFDAPKRSSFGGMRQRERSGGFNKSYEPPRASERGRGGARGRGGRGRGERSAAPKSAEDLDKELESFMAGGGEDVDMA